MTAKGVCPKWVLQAGQPRTAVPHHGFRPESRDRLSCALSMVRPALIFLMSRRAGARGRFGCMKGGIRSAENHAAGTRLQHARDRQPNGLAEVVSALLRDDHGPVIQV